MQIGYICHMKVLSCLHEMDPPLIYGLNFIDKNIRQSNEPILQPTY